MRIYLLLPLLVLACETGDEDAGDTDETDVVDTDVVETDTTTETDETDETDDTEPVVAQPMDVSIVPATPVAGEALTCSPSKPGDALYRWERNGIDASVSVDTVAADRTDAYETWTCYAATVDGLWAGSGEVEIAERCGALKGNGEEVAAVVAPKPLLTRVNRSFTIEAWVRWETAPEADADLIVHAGLISSEPANTDYTLRLTGDGKLLFLTGGTVDGCADQRVDAPAAGSWHHIAGTWDEATGLKRLWVNGLQAASCTTTDRPANALGALYLAGALTSVDFVASYVRPFAGHLDEIRLSSNVRYGFAFAPELYFTPDAETVMLLHANTTGTFGTPQDPWQGTPDASGNNLHAKYAASVTDVVTDATVCDIR